MKIFEIFDKKYLMRVLSGFLSACLTLGILVYVGYHVADRFSPGLELVDATLTTVTKSISADAYIMRDETALYASNARSGSVVPSVEDGGKFPAYAKLVSVYSESMPDTEKRLAEIDKQISLLEKNKSADRSVQSTTGIESQIYDSVFRLRALCDSGRYSDAVNLRTDLLLNIKKIEILTGEISDYSRQISILASERASLTSRLGTCLETVYSNSSGYYFSENDGYSRIFSSGKAGELTYDDFISMTNAEPSTGDKLCVGTIVNGYTWYIAFTADKTDAREIGSMKECSVRFAYSDMTLGMDVYRIVEDTDGEEALVILKCEKMPAGFDYTRMQPVNIYTTSYTGFKIPLSAVRVLDGYEGVYIKDEVTTAFRRINIVYESDGYVLCTGNPSDDEADEDSQAKDQYLWIARNDIVIAGGTELYSGKIID